MQSLSGNIVPPSMLSLLPCCLCVLSIIHIPPIPLMWVEAVLVRYTRSFLWCGRMEVLTATMSNKSISSYSIHPCLSTTASILGQVYDVSKGVKHYGVGGAYHGFTGKDGTRAFITGDFTQEGLSDDVSGLDPKECLGIKVRPFVSE
ncbi:unnamed protein product [Choristocarpus tenellus]